MKRTLSIQHEFVEYIPEELEDGRIYVSIAYATAVHKCCCGCQNKVITPISPTDWKLTFNGESISLSPSIGNWSFECQSHYWIENNRVEWASKWSQKQIKQGRELDNKNKKEHQKKNKRNVFSRLFKKK
jgi:hypothetical protein